MADAPMHPAVEPIAFLLGTWRGEGRGEFPTIEPFAYTEEIRFWHVGKPFLAYAQRTTRTPDGTPAHAEMGYWRAVGDGGLEVVLAHPTGIAEIQVGAVADGRIDLRSASLARTPTAKEVTALERTLELDGDVLRYTLRMAAVGIPLTHHLAAELRRVAD